MPRKPTARARAAAGSLRELIAGSRPGEPLPPVRELAGRWSVHASTVCRLLQDFSDEGAAWRSPAGRYHAAGGRASRLKGRSLCFVGREMNRWGRRYRELLEGVAEVCSANGGNLVLVSSPSLVVQRSPEDVPRFAAAKRQARALRDCLARAPRDAAGFVFDHLWGEPLVAAAAAAGREKRSMLLPGALSPCRPDYGQGAALACAHARRAGYGRIVVARPFAGDPAIDAIIASVENAADLPVGVAAAESGAQCRGLLRAAAAGRGRTCVMVPEDNAALRFAALLEACGSGPDKTGLLALQGTGAVASPITHLRYDYRRIGRATAAGILHGRRPFVAPASLVLGRTTSGGR